MVLDRNRSPRYSKGSRFSIQGEKYFDITWVMRVSGSAGVPHASIRACRFEPLPDIRTAMLYLDSDMFNYLCL